MHGMIAYHKGPLVLLISFLFVLFLWPRHMASGFLVPQPVIEPVLPAVEMWSPNCWAARKVPVLPVLNDIPLLVNMLNELSSSYCVSESFVDNLSFF